MTDGELAYAECVLAGLRFHSGDKWVGIGTDTQMFCWMKKNGTELMPSLRGLHADCPVSHATAMRALVHYCWLMSEKAK